jgi:hypothetical protein
MLSAGDGGSRSWHSLLRHQWVAALRAEAAVLAHDPPAQPATSPKQKRTPIAGRPSPGIRQPDTGATSRLRAFWPASNPARPLPGLAGLSGAANLAHQQLIGGDQRDRRPRCDHAPDQAWLGHGHIGRQAGDAARDQKCPRQCSTFASRPRIGPGAWSTQRRSSRPPPAASGRQPSLAARATPPAQVHMKIGDGASDQRQQSNASDRCPPDPPVRAGGHDRLPTGNSPMSTHCFLGAHTPGLRETALRSRRIHLRAPPALEPAHRTRRISRVRRPPRSARPPDGRDRVLA